MLNGDLVTSMIIFPKKKRKTILYKIWMDMFTKKEGSISDED